MNKKEIIKAKKEVFDDIDKIKKIPVIVDIITMEQGYDIYITSDQYKRLKQKHEVIK